jgi:hypothetical protein
MAATYQISQADNLSYSKAAVMSDSSNFLEVEQQGQM